jgi:MFS family permease
MQKVNEFLEKLDSVIGGSPWFVFVLLGTGLFFTLYLKFPQIRYFRHALRIVSGKYDKKTDKGDATHFQALATALSGTVGTGNIVGVALAIYLGILAGMLITPFLVLHLGLGGALLAYGLFSAAVVGVFFAFVKERPPTPPCPTGQEERSLVFDGLKQMLRQRDFLLLLAIFFVGLGAFNAISTWIEDILRPRGFSVTQAGVTGGLMIVGGIAGAIVIPLLSDHFRRRKPFLVLAVVGAMAGTLGLTYAEGYPLLLASAFVLGFFLLSAGPLGFQYGAEITYPAPEGTSNGLLLLMGQIAGIAFIVGMDAFKSPQTGAMTTPLLVLLALMGVALALTLGLHEVRSLLTTS